MKLLRLSSLKLYCTGSELPREVKCLQISQIGVCVNDYTNQKINIKVFLCFPTPIPLHFYTEMFKTFHFGKTIFSAMLFFSTGNYEPKYFGVAAKTELKNGSQAQCLARC